MKSSFSKLKGVGHPVYIISTATGLESTVFDHFISTYDNVVTLMIVTVGAFLKVLMCMWPSAPIDKLYKKYYRHNETVLVCQLISRGDFCRCS